MKSPKSKEERWSHIIIDMSHYLVKREEQTLSLEGCSSSPEGDFLEGFSSDMRIDIIHLDEESVVFDLVGVDVSIANALRRILLAEVPTVAIETVYIQENTSIVQDEVLSHRLGLVPIRADPRLFDDFSPDDEATDLNTIVFKLDVACNADEGSSDEWRVGEDGGRSFTAYSGKLEWQPQGDQAEKFAGEILCEACNVFFNSFS
jgi:DNA-directed RNA polymerases I and III subunit RPAC1